MSELYLADRFGRTTGTHVSANPAHNFKKATPPKFGPMNSGWMGNDVQFLTLPGGGVVQFDLNRLCLDDFRGMRDHYQINANLALLSFMQHQIEWTITGPNGRKPKNKKQAQFVEDVLRKAWTRLCRAMGQADWAGYSPCALEYENQGSSTILNKVKDIVPEYAEPNWKYIEGWAPDGRVRPKLKEFDGIKIRGMSWPLPRENSFWYSLLMENGNMYGKKLLRPAFTSWFFSILLHLFSNRYFERFGEPLPIGRAPFDDTVEVGKKEDGTPNVMAGREAMEVLVRNIRSRAVTVLPSQRSQIGLNTTGIPPYDYDIEYLESQMRGADFERYMTRLDEEMSLALFTPILLLRVADVGSYNLGTGHTQLFLWMLNAMTLDRKEYIDRFIVKPLKDFNFGPNAEELEWSFRPMGKQNAETIRAIITELVRDNRVKLNLAEMGDAVGLSLEEVKILDPSADPAIDPSKSDPGAPTPDNRGPRNKPKSSGPRSTSNTSATTANIRSRLSAQITKAFADGTVGNKPIKMGYIKQFTEALKADGCADPQAFAETYYATVNTWLEDAWTPGVWRDADNFLTVFSNVLDQELGDLVYDE